MTGHERKVSTMAAKTTTPPRTIGLGRSPHIEAQDMLAEAREKCAAIESALAAWAMVEDAPSPRALVGFSTILRDVYDTMGDACALLNGEEVA